ncbi:arylesterase [Desulfococcus sp.]|uniref:arylesterase n=1 Tax=Desulfococcus sp. TaxID=2025834 RepID=UPI00359365BA
MKRQLWILSALALLSTALCGCDGKPAAEAPPSLPMAAAAPEVPAGVIAAFGDSLTEGLGVDEETAYPALLEAKLRASGLNYTVINAGISGETSSGALSRVRWVLTLKPDIVILETGANDGLRGVDPALTRKNIREIVRILQGEGVVVVLAGMEMFRNLGAEFTGAFREIYPSVAADENVLLIPFFLKGVAGDPRLNLPDGIHPNPEGYRIVAETVYPHVIEAIGRLKTHG